MPRIAPQQLLRVWLILSIVGSIQATTIIVVYGSDSILIGADSLRTEEDGSFGENVCKVNEAEGIVFTFVGFTSLASDQSEARDVVVRAFSASRAGMLNKVAAAEQALKLWVQKVVDSVRINRPTLFWTWTRQEEWPTGIAFSGFENNVAIVLYDTFKVDEGGFVIRGRDDLRARVPSGFFTLGYRSAFSDQTFAASYRSLGPSEAVKLAINSQAKATPEHTGLPISIVEVTRNGIHWREKGICKPG